MKIYRIMMLCGWACFALGLISCSKQMAGGSVGTDNPQASATVADGAGNVVTDSVNVRVWLVDQNPITNPNPILDTVIAGTKVVAIDAEKLGLAGKAWNIEAKTNDGRCGLVRNLTVYPSGSIYQNQVAISDTFVIALQASGSRLVLETTVRDTNSWGSDIIVVDTLESSQEKGLDYLPPVYLEAGTPSVRPPTAYLVVLGTSIVIPVDGASLPSAGTLGLPPGQYSMAAMDAAGVVLYTVPVVILP